MGAGVPTPAEVQRVLGVEQSAFAMDVLYRQLELGLLETSDGVLQLTSLGETALKVGRAPTRSWETFKLLIDPAGAIVDGTRIKHTARRHGDLRHGARPELQVSQIQDFVSDQREWREKNAVVTDMDSERLEQRMVMHGCRAVVDLDLQEWRNVILDRGGQPSAPLNCLVEKVDWEKAFDLIPAPAGQPDFWSLFAEGMLLDEEVRRQARKLIDCAHHSLHVVGWDLTGQGTHAYSHSLDHHPELRLTADLTRVTDDWEKLRSQFGARVTLKETPRSTAILTSDDQELRATSTWVPMPPNKAYGQTLIVATSTALAY